MIQQFPLSTAGRNFALHGDGARIISAFTSPSHDSSGRRSALRQLLCDFPELNPPEVILEDDVHVGECFEFQGSYGQIGISLPEPVHISSVSLEHVSPTMVSSGRARQAPKEIEVWASLERGAVLDSRWSVRSAHSFHISSSHSLPANATPSFVRAAQLEFDLFGVPLRQQFHVTEVLPACAVRHIIIVVRSNWGSDSTCLYHVGVYGNISLQNVDTM
ncbi:hypothetical protein HGRIS_000869 [Hohenbuehelia grisea]|uniref:SUN domain-containing protein n=1 Tax=Hohenbuehelia grisea TaxID=104357 RepID=A0ABR3IQ17_9AGAR